MSYNTKNYTEQGGEKTVIGGRLEIESGAELILKSGATLTNQNTDGGEDQPEAAVIPYLANSTSTSASNLTKDLNALLKFLRASGLMASAAPTIAISQQPEDARAATNTPVTLSMEAASSDGRELAFQWYSNSSASNTGGTKIADGISRTYQPPYTSSGAFYFYCVASDASGGATESVAPATSDAVTVTFS